MWDVDVGEVSYISCCLAMSGTNDCWRSDVTSSVLRQLLETGQIITPHSFQRSALNINNATAVWSVQPHAAGLQDTPVI